VRLGRAVNAVHVDGAILAPQGGPGGAAVGGLGTKKMERERKDWREVGGLETLFKIVFLPGSTSLTFTIWAM
jgi:hypothetical protein